MSILASDHFRAGNGLLHYSNLQMEHFSTDADQYAQEFPKTFQYQIAIQILSSANPTSSILYSFKNATCIIWRILLKLLVTTRCERIPTLYRILSSRLSGTTFEVGEKETPAYTNTAKFIDRYFMDPDQGVFNEQNAVLPSWPMASK